jgi:hypothetical protein
MKGVKRRPTALGDTMRLVCSVVVNDRAGRKIWTGGD